MKLQFFVGHWHSVDAISYSKSVFRAYWLEYLVNKIVVLRSRRVGSSNVLCMIVCVRPPRRVRYAFWTSRKTLNLCCTHKLAEKRTNLANLTLIIHPRFSVRTIWLSFVEIENNQIIHEGNFNKLQQTSKLHRQGRKILWPNEKMERKECWFNYNNEKNR